MNAEATLLVRCRDARTGSSLESVLSPDNVGIPREQRFTVKRAGPDIGFAVSSKTASSALSTLLSLLRDASLFQEISLLSEARIAAVGRRRSLARRQAHTGKP